ncbi:AMP-binding protein [Nocardiopsis coralliicola]
MPDSPTAAFRAARDALLAHRDPEQARAAFAWPRPERFNWVEDHFDPAAGEHPDRTALRIVATGDGGPETDTSTALTYAELAARSRQVANWLHAQGVRPGDRILLMLGNQVELWETVLAAIRLGAVVIPATTLLTAADIADRIRRGGVAHVVANAADAPRFEGIEGHWTRISVGWMEGWAHYEDSQHAGLDFAPEHRTRAADPLLLYFTSGTTAEPKLVEHTHLSYPAGHLSTMYWIGVRPGDVHLNISSPGWAKHAWSSLFAPLNAQATVLVVDQPRFDAAALLDRVAAAGVDTFCAPPTVWRMLVQAGLGRWQTSIREAVSAGEPLNPEVIEQVRTAWGLTVRDGFGQTETTLLAGNVPGGTVTPGELGGAMPGYDIVLEDPATGEPAGTGEICVDLANAPVGVMRGYRDDAERTEAVMRGGRYHTGDVATYGADGGLVYIGRSDDVFKAADYRISPFELESVLIEHAAVAEAAVVPAPDPIRHAVPKAYVVLAADTEPDAATARSILAFCRERLAPFKRIRRLEFAALPKTISGKIRRVELRTAEESRGGERGAAEFREEDFPDLRS